MNVPKIPHCTNPNSCLRCLTQIALRLEAKGIDAASTREQIAELNLRDAVDAYWTHIHNRTQALQTTVAAAKQTERQSSEEPAPIEAELTKLILEDLRINGPIAQAINNITNTRRR